MLGGYEGYCLDLARCCAALCISAQQSSLHAHVCDAHSVAVDFSGLQAQSIVPSARAEKRVLLFSEHDLDSDFQSMMTNTMTLISTLRGQGYEVEAVPARDCLIQVETPTKEAEGIKTVIASPLFLYRKIAEHHSLTIIFTSEFLLCQQARLACVFLGKKRTSRDWRPAGIASSKIGSWFRSGSAGHFCETSSICPTVTLV